MVLLLNVPALMLLLADAVPRTVMRIAVPCEFAEAVALVIVLLLTLIELTGPPNCVRWKPW